MARIPKQIPRAAQEGQHPSAVPPLATCVLDHEDINLETQPMDVDEESQTFENQQPRGVAHHHSEAGKDSTIAPNDFSVPPTSTATSTSDSDIGQTNRSLLNHILTNITNTFLYAARLDHSNDTNAPSTPVTTALHALYSDVPFAGNPPVDLLSTMEPRTRNLIELLTSTQQAASEAGELRQRVSSLEVQNEGLIRTREIEVERLRDIVKGLADKVAQQRREIRTWEGMAMDREGEVQRLRQRLDLWQQGGEGESIGDGGTEP